MEELEKIRQDVLDCRACQLCQYRNNVVFGEGNPHAKVMLIGEAPGEQEDLAGKPFVGRSGQLLRKMLSDNGFDLERDVYITNILKCRPPKNRDPLPQEQDLCKNFLKRQIRSVHPKLLVCVGRISACKIIDKNFRIMRQHGELFKVGDYLATATLHPAVILRNNNNLPIAMDDWAKIKQLSEEL